MNSFNLSTYMTIAVAISIPMLATIAVFIEFRRWKKAAKSELFVNYHLTPKTSSCLTLDEAKRGLKLLAAEGGEPFMVKRGKFLGELLKYCKEELKPAPICSVITNGSMLTDRWCEKYAKYLDIFAVSIDSFDDEINRKIGRYSKGKQTQTEIVKKCFNLCQKYNVPLKINTVVNTYNCDEDMNAAITELNPIRWKVFQCLLIEGENLSTASMSALRDATKFVISDDKFAEFVARHKNVECIVYEDNKTMRNSYQLMDEEMRFLNCANGKKEPSESILKVGVQQALDATVFEKDMFDKRGGDYEIPQANGGSSCDFDGNNPEYQW